MESTVLFIDDNYITARIAEVVGKDLIPKGVDLQSAGYDPVSASSEIIDRFLNAYNTQWGSAVSIEDVICKQYDLIISLTDIDPGKDRIFPGVPPVIRWKIPPIDLSSTDSFRNCGEILTTYIKDLFNGGYFNALLQQRTLMGDVLNSLQDGIIAHDLNRKVFLFSRGAEILTGVSKELVLGRDCHELFAPHICGNQCIFCGENADYSQIPKSSFPSLFNTFDGSRKEFDVTRVPLRNEFGVVVGTIATIHDTTRVRELEVRLGEMESFSGIIGQDHKMLEVFELIKDLAQSDFPVVITGESGTGKELVAAAVHKESMRRDQLFVPVNCGALPEGTLESELFGHLKGSFTGAIRDKKGRFELADKGTLFLDEIGELSTRMQVKLLRVLQEGVFEPVGSEHSKKVDVRILCATNRNLKEMVAAGTFREDLYYRLAVVPIEIPPLRERRTDIAILATHFLEKNTGKLARGEMHFSEDALSCLMSHQWPGNVRQLQNAIQYSLIKCRGSVILPEHLPPEIVSASFLPPSYLHSPGKAGRKPKLTLDIVERALAKAGGNKAKAARFLGVGRATLYNFLTGNKDMLDYPIERC
jgi:PAS domain S-box-containing protein